MPSLNNTSSQPFARPLNRQDYKTLGLSSLGGTLEFYDFVILSFMPKSILQLFFRVIINFSL